MTNSVVPIPNEAIASAISGHEVDEERRADGRAGTFELTVARHARVAYRTNLCASRPRAKKIFRDASRRVSAPGRVAAHHAGASTPSTLSSILTSSPTTAPPVSSAWCQVKPKSLRLIFVRAS